MARRGVVVATNLGKEALAHLTSEGISKKIAEACKLYEIPGSFGAKPRIAFPYYDKNRRPIKTPDGKPFVRSRLLGETIDGHKYHQEPGTPNHAYLPPVTDFRKPSGTEEVVEGEKEAIHLAMCGIRAIAIAQVHGGGVMATKRSDKVVPHPAEPSRSPKGGLQVRYGEMRAYPLSLFLGVYHLSHTDWTILKRQGRAPRTRKIKGRLYVSFRSAERWRLEMEKELHVLEQWHQALTEDDERKGGRSIWQHYMEAESK